MAAKTYSKEEISSMSYEMRYSHYKQEEAKLLMEAKNISVSELSNRLKEIADRWNV